jgi:hypothetical protein
MGGDRERHPWEGHAEGRSEVDIVDQEGAGAVIAHPQPSGGTVPDANGAKVESTDLVPYEVGHASFPGPL